MNAHDDPGRMVSQWLEEYSAHRVPEHLDAVLGETSTRHQRPAWSSLERWLPMDLTNRASTFPAPRLGRVLLIVLLALALATAAAVVIASRQHRVPPPFGPAANGIQIASGDGDIFALDATTHQRRPLVTGPSWDFGTTWSRDGTQFLFLRTAAQPDNTVPALLTMAVAAADGSNVREVVGPVTSLDWFDWSPDGGQVAFVARDSRGNGLVNVVDVPTGRVATFALPVSVGWLAWRPDGREILLRSEGKTPAIYAVHPDGTGYRPVSTRPALNEADFSDPVMSPDGGRLLYTSYRSAIGPSLYLLDLATGKELGIPTPIVAAAGAGVFSQAGDRIAFLRSRAGGTFEVVVAPADGSSEGSAVGASMPMSADKSMDASLAFAPDDSALIVRKGDDSYSTFTWLPLDGSPSSTLDKGAFEFIDVQRLAP